MPLPTIPCKTGQALLSVSALSADFAALAADCHAALQAGADMLHLDVMDGHFVPNISIGIPVVKSLRAALPDVFFDTHLMISNPLRYVNDFAKAGADLISFHVEANSPVQETIDAIHAAGAAAGLVVKPDTHPSAVLPYLEDIELVLVMSVEPGFGGQAFMPSALAKLRFLADAAARQKNENPLLLQVDGGLDDKTAPLAREAGANVIVAGSYFFGAADRVAAAHALKGTEAERGRL